MLTRGGSNGPNFAKNLAKSLSVKNCCRKDLLTALRTKTSLSRVSRSTRRIRSTPKLGSSSLLVTSGEFRLRAPNLKAGLAKEQRPELCSLNFANSTVMGLYF